MPVGVARRSSGHQFRQGGGWGRVAGAANADHAVDDHHADPRQVAQFHALQETPAGGVLGPVHDHEIGGPAGLDEAAVQLAQARRVAGGEAKGRFGRYPAQTAEQGDDPQDTQRLHPRAGRGIGAQDDPLRLAQLRADPSVAPWLLRAVILRETASLVGHVGFHDRPGNPALREWAPEGVELGYTTFESYRRRGFAREAVLALVTWAERQHAVPHFVASIAPTNLASRSLARNLGFRLVGSTVDEVDGLEEVWLRDEKP